MQSSAQFFPVNPVVSRGSQITAWRVNHAPAVSPPVRWAFYAFVFSILFEEFALPIPLEVIHITGGFLIMAVVFLQPGVGLRRPPLAFWCFILYTCAGIGTLLYYRQFFDDEILTKQFKSAQLLLLFWVSYNLMRHEKTARGALLSLVASCAVLSVLQTLGMTSTTEKVLSKTSRFSAFGLGPGQLAGVLGLGLLASFGLCYGLKKSPITPRALIWPVFILIGMTLVKTGSRGPLIALGAGFLVFILREGTLLTKVRNAFVVVLGIGCFLWIASYSDIVKHRFEVTIEDGSMSARERIYPNAVQMFLERPLIGWGPVANTWELGNRVQIPRYERLDTHNLVLYVTTSTGIMGAIPFFIGVGLCALAAFKSRRGVHGVLPLAMTASVLMADMSSSGLHWKQHWLILAYAMASSSMYER